MKISAHCMSVLTYSMEMCSFSSCSAMRLRAGTRNRSLSLRHPREREVCVCGPLNTRKPPDVDLASFSPAKSASA